jgi:hypothetical protein
VIAEPVFFLVGEISMARAKDLPECVIIRGPCIGIPYDQGNRHPGGLSLKYPREDLNPVSFSPLRSERAGTRPPPVKDRLDVLH